MTTKKALKTGDKVVLFQDNQGDCSKLIGIDGTLVKDVGDYGAYIVFAKGTKLPRGYGWATKGNEELSPHGDKAWYVAIKDLKAAPAPAKIKPSAMTILKHLQRGLTISPAEALRVYKNSRLAASIYDLKQAGYEITKEMRRDLTGQRYARYSLAGNA